MIGAFRITNSTLARARAESVKFENAVIASLRRQLDEAHDRIATLESRLEKPFMAPACYRLTRSQGLILSALMRKGVATHAALREIIYGEAPCKHVPQMDQTIKAMIFYMRRKLNLFGVQIHTLWGQGYYLDLESKNRCRFMAKEGE